MRMPTLPIAALLLLFCFSAKSQGLVSGFMNGKDRGAIALSFTAERYETAFLVPEDADEIPIFNELRINSVTLFATYGVSPDLDLILNLPYIRSEGFATQQTLDELGYENSRSGLQDISLFLKYKLHAFRVGASRLDFIALGGIKTPVSNYKVDEGLQSILAIGNRATSLTAGGIAQLRMPVGIYVAGQAGYSYRSGEVPDAVVGEIKVGYGSSKIHVAGWYAKQFSLGGVDVLGEGFDGFFPATDVSFTRAGLNVYTPIAKGFGLSGGVNRYVSGRNVGKSTGFSTSLVFTF